MTLERHKSFKVTVSLLFLVIISPRQISGDDFFLPTLYMPLKTLMPLGVPGSPEAYLRVTSEHIREHEQWSLEEVYSKTFTTIKSKAIMWIGNGSQVPANNFDSKWSYNISFQTLNSSYSSEDFRQTITPSHVQEVLLDLLSKRFLFDINKVASRLNVPVANLSKNYDPANWEAAVHAMVEESILTYLSRLELGSVESLAKLVHLTVSDLKTSALAAYESLVPPLYPKKSVLDHNITRVIVDAPGVPAPSPEDIVVTKLVHEATALKAEDFAILYNLTDEQVKTLMRTTFHQISRMCSVSVPALMNMTLPSLSWSVVGSKSKNPTCPVLITIKGKSISELPNIDPNSMSVLVLLTASTDLTWRKVFEAVNASLSDWEILDSVSIQQLAAISGQDKLNLLNDSLSVSVELIYKLNENGSMTKAIRDHRIKVRSSLETLFNLTTIQVTNLTGITEEQLEIALSSIILKSFLNATVFFFNITWKDIYVPANMTLHELNNLPGKEWNGIVPHIIRAALKLEAIKLEVSEEALQQFLNISPKNGSIAVLKQLIETRIKLLLQRRDRFENQTLQTYLSAKSIADDDYLNSTILSVLMAASDLTIPDFRLMYGIDAGQLFVLQHIKFKDLTMYCGMNGTEMKGRTPFNITAELVGIQKNLATCKTTRFYAGSKSKPLSELKVHFSILQNVTAPFMRIIEEITGLPWRRNVWAYGVKMEDWTILDALTIKAFAEVTSQSVSTVEGETLQSIFNSAVKLKADDDAKVTAVLHTYKIPVVNELFTVFRTNSDELITVLKITQAQIDVYTLPQLLQRTLDYYHQKFNVSLLNVGKTLAIVEKDLHNLAPTEWHEMLQPLKDEIMRSGRTQLDLSLENFSILFGQSSGNLTKLDLSQLKSLWDSVFVRLRRAKDFMESKTISQLIALLNVEQSSFWDMSVMTFVETSLGLKKSELTLLCSFDSDGLDVLTNFTFAEVSTACGLTKTAINGETPFSLIRSLLGMDNPMKCRAVALASSARMMTLEKLSKKFSVFIDDSDSFLDVVERLIPLPWSKIAWALNITLSQWPRLGAVSLTQLVQIESKTPADIRMQKSLKQIALDIVALRGPKFDNLLGLYRNNLTQTTSYLFAVNWKEVCNSPSIKMVDIFGKVLTVLRATVQYHTKSVSSQMDLSDYEFKLLPPSGWRRVVPLIIADSYGRLSASLGISTDRLSIQLGYSSAYILDMTMKSYVSLMEAKINPLVQHAIPQRTRTLKELADFKGVPVAELRNKNVLEVITTLAFPMFNNSTLGLYWSSEDMSILQSYTLGYVAAYKLGGVDGLMLLTPFDLLPFIIERVDGCPLPTTPPLTKRPSCSSGYVLQDDNVTCKAETKTQANEGFSKFTIMAIAFPCLILLLVAIIVRLVRRRKRNRERGVNNPLDNIEMPAPRRYGKPPSEIGSGQEAEPVERIPSNNYMDLSCPSSSEYTSLSDHNQRQAETSRVAPVTDEIPSHDYENIDDILETLTITYV